MAGPVQPREFYRGLRIFGCTKELMVSSLSYADLDHNLFLGTCPRGNMDALHLRNEADVDLLINLQTEEDFRALGLRPCHGR